MKLHDVFARFKITLIISAMLILSSNPIYAAPENSPWGKDYFPNLELVNQEGKKVRFYDDLIKNKIVAINFIFTHCGDSCPAETANLRQVQKILADRMGKDIFFYSISIDPEQDTPELLKAYAKRFNVGLGWSFLTGNQNDITMLRKLLGLYREEIKSVSLAEHTTSFMIGNEATGQWVKRSPFDEPKALARQLGRVLSTFNAYHNSDLRTYDEAKKIPEMRKGEEKFRFRCASCHSLGKEDGIGPGLQDVTKLRNKAWLFRWLKAPDLVLAEKDPIAVELYERYNKVLMPNYKLDDAEVESLIQYMAN